ncbi:helix-turn-helix domain-containing protein [Halovivax gelatinilyticus]|uniref:helix-turn-helix domain-containing protein n=1 Tax=Halovivax gelatinilyticus TaxID=2961597 RepID=UPI0020CA3505|nr:helix-turn-helix domain-containing protein [Halovivax gelatinilyticus]
MQSADLTLRLPPEMQLPVPDLVELGSVYREEVLSWGVDERRDQIRFLSIVAGEIDVVRELAADLERAESPDVYRYDLTPIDDDTFYLYAELGLRAADSMLFEPFDRPGLVLVPPVVYTGRDVVRFTVLGEGDALANVLDAVPDAVGVTVERVSDHRRRTETLTGRLTNRQFEALSIARELGYYEVPRESNLAAVADRLECSESAASRLLRTAERALVESAF